jgi:hypothetical protein
LRGLVIALTGLCAAASSFAQQTSPVRARISSPISFYDDADPSVHGMLNVSESYAYNKIPVGQDVTFTSTYASLGLNKRIDVSANVSYGRSVFEGTRIAALSDSYFGSKLLLMPETKRRPALALEPMIEVLGDASIAGSPLAPKRVNYVLPFITQKSFDHYRIYYMAGYLTRGIIYNSLAFELNRWSRITPLVIMSGSRLTRELGLVSALGLNRSRSDVIGSVAVTLRPGWSLFVSSGRSVGRVDLNSSRYQITGGVSFNVRLWGKK